MKQLSRHISFANVISCVALFVALGGAAYAATTLGKKSVKTKNLANGSVTTLKLRGGAVTNLKLRNGAVTGAKIANATIGSSQLANGAVRSAQLGGGVVTSAKLKNGAVTGEKIGNGAATTEKIANGAVTNSKLSASLLGQLAKGVAYATKASLSNESEKIKSASAECPSGKQVIGGGAKILGSVESVVITESAPVVSGSGRVAWSAAAQDIPALETGAWAVEAFAICAEL